MSRVPLPIYRFGKGLQTKSLEDFQPPDEFRIFQDARVKQGVVKRRAGQARVAVAGSDNAAQNFDGSNDVATFPRYTGWAWQSLGLRWTLRLLLSGDDTPAGDEYLLGWSSTGNKPLTIKRTSSRTIVVDHWDAAGTQVTLTSTATTDATSYPLMVTRDASTLRLWLGPTNDATSTSLSATSVSRVPADNLTFGAHNGANFLDGTLDYCDLRSTVAASANDGFLRLSDPRADDVMFCVGFEKTANGHLTDLSRFDSTGLVSGASNATALCVQSSPVLGMEPWVDATGNRKVLTIAGGLVYNVGMA